MKTKLQLALDDITLDQAVALLDQIQESIDIVETGTPFVMEYGMHAVRILKEKFPDLEILCDGKIMDAGSYEAGLTFQAGADYTTVLAVTDDKTIEDVVAAARKTSGKVVADMICVSNLTTRARELEHLGIDMIAVHTGVDQQAQGRTPLDDLKELSSLNLSVPVAVAGGIRVDTLPDYLACNPGVIIVGGGILHAADPVATARQLADMIKKHNLSEDLS